MSTTRRQVAQRLMNRYGPPYPDFRNWEELDLPRVRQVAEGRWSSTEMLVLRLAEHIAAEPAWEAVDDELLAGIFLTIAASISGREGCSTEAT